MANGHKANGHNIILSIFIETSSLLSILSPVFPQWEITPVESIEDEEKKREEEKEEPVHPSILIIPLRIDLPWLRFAFGPSWLFFVLHFVPFTYLIIHIFSQNSHGWLAILAGHEYSLFLIMILISISSVSIFL